MNGKLAIALMKADVTKIPHTELVAALSECSDRDHAAMHDTDSPHDDDQQQWRLVPVTPTPEMLAAVSWPGCAATDYAHMLAAAPQPPSAQADAVDALRRLVAAIIDDDDDDDDGNAPGHAHGVPGVWDDDNRAGIAGKPCELCAAWRNARAVLAAHDEKGPKQ